VLVGCWSAEFDPFTVDADGDGLSDGAELDLGADPANPDSDGDLVPDGAEVSAGSDPLLEDTDEDGYLDFDEIAEGHDPADAKDRIYRGNWPYYRNKDELKGGSKNGTATVGERWGRFKLVDQFGDKVDLFDFYNEEGKMIVIDQSAVWCGPCNSVAAFMDGDDGAWPYDPSLIPLREAIERGDIYFITVLIQGGDGSPAERVDVKDWFATYPSRDIPVLADSRSELSVYMPAPGIPAFALLNADLTVASFDPADGFVGLVDGVAAAEASAR
jgi:hypothetical protein